MRKRERKFHGNRFECLSLPNTPLNSLLLSPIEIENLSHKNPLLSVKNVRSFSKNFPQQIFQSISAWINNCVGHRNHVYFVRFLFFAVVGCLHATIILGCILYQTFSVVGAFGNIWDFQQIFPENPSTPSFSDILCSRSTSPQTRCLCNSLAYNFLFCSVGYGFCNRGYVGGRRPSLHANSRYYSQPNRNRGVYL